MGRYRKIEPRFWRDENVRKLSLQEKAVAIYLVTAQSNRIGIFLFSKALAAEELEILPPIFGKYLKRVLETLKWAYDEHARVLYIPTWWKYNQPTNPNILQSCLSDLSELPRTPLIAKFYSNTEHLSEIFANRLREAVGNIAPNITPNITPNIRPQEQEQEQEQEQKNTPPIPVESDERSSTKRSGVREAKMLERGFKVFWSHYPRREGKQEAWKAWMRLCPDEGLTEKMIEWIEQAKQSEQWRDKQFVPHPATFLNQRRWDGDIPPSKAVGGGTRFDQLDKLAAKGFQGG